MGCGSSKSSAATVPPTAASSAPTPRSNPPAVLTPAAPPSAPSEERKVDLPETNPKNTATEAPALVSEVQISNQENVSPNDRSVQPLTPSASVAQDKTPGESEATWISATDPSGRSEAQEQETEQDEVDYGSVSPPISSPEQRPQPSAAPVILMQRVWRGSLCRKIHKRLMEEQKRRVLLARALLIQRVWRGSVGRRIHQRAVQEHKRRVAASTLLQCVWRCRVSSRALLLLKQLDADRKRKERACLAIQSSARCLIARRVSRQRRRLLACVSIQNAFRGHWSRVQLKLLREAAFKRQVAGVLLAQRLWRGCRARARFRSLRDERRRRELEIASSTVLQCLWRCCVSRRCLQGLREQDAFRKRIASTTIQSRVRILISQRRLRELRIAALEALKRRSATTIQVPFFFTLTLTPCSLSLLSLLSLSILSLCLSLSLFLSRPAETCEAIVAKTHSGPAERRAAPLSSHPPRRTAT
jgi:hypothetical protein